MAFSTGTWHALVCADDETGALTATKPTESTYFKPVLTTKRGHCFVGFSSLSESLLKTVVHRINDVVGFCS